MSGRNWLDGAASAAAEHEQSSMTDIMNMVNAAVHQEHNHIMVVYVDEKFTDTVLADGNSRMIGMLQLVHGAYFDTNIMYGGRHIWKSVQIPEGHYSHMLWFVNDNSWYCADSLFIDNRERDVTTISLWSKLEDDAIVPRAVHFPYWSKTACGDISILDLRDYTPIDPLYMMTHPVDGVMQCKLAARIMELENLLADAQGEVDRLKGHCGKSSSSSSQQCGGKGGGKGEQSRAGWMPKVATVVTAVYEKKSNYVKKLCDRMYHESPTLKKLVDTKLSWT